ncbi:2-hydroxychromene-2-carboxylate isomerase [Caenimonas aquaedulcis]|uniref:2-hydroxychromene-2-carboxylate isomerase n=1 Tax=Caenimonas aquaedulcis TaxID=2793270 RepID=A0A931MGL5_9BURK|nr:2-hydroxychromene-2-carboxylate isomerase [Caenimonas aquaedulcis]MBG9387410.1 2-hydroxychromene-2-carboxylate isomerase [Caenimonas aquaedulcis]
MEASPVHFYFDFISPYGWLASMRIEEIAARHGRRVEWHAMLLGVAVMKVMGLKPLLDTPLKGDYVRRDVARHFRRLGFEPARAAGDPAMDPLPAARAFHWVKQRHPELAGAFARAVYDAYWRGGKDLSTAQALVSIALPDGIDASALRAAIGSDEARQLLRQAVEASLAAGIFGSPTVVVDGESFWGVDRLGDVDEWLGRGGW